MPRIIRNRTPEEFYDTLRGPRDRDADLARAMQAVADEMARAVAAINPTSEACTSAHAYMAKPKRLRVVA